LYSLIEIKDWMDTGMNKEELIKILKGLLKTETNLDYLFELKKEDLERLVAVVRGRLDE
jgi:hypothetical protein